MEANKSLDSHKNTADVYTIIVTDYLANATSSSTYACSKAEADSLLNDKQATLTPGPTTGFGNAGSMMLIGN